MSAYADGGSVWHSGTVDVGPRISMRRARMPWCGGRAPYEHVMISPVSHTLAFKHCRPCQTSIIFWGATAQHGIPPTWP
jgi:hypothetical protein